MFSWAKNDSSTEPSMMTRQSSVHSVIEAVDSTYAQNRFITACLCGLSICVPRPKQPCAEDMLYCSLCEVEVGLLSFVKWSNLICPTVCNSYVHWVVYAIPDFEAQQALQGLW
jgi:hypothetical protein